MKIGDCVWGVIGGNIEKILVAEIVGKVVVDVHGVHYAKWFESLDDAFRFIEGIPKIGDCVWVINGNSVVKFVVSEIHTQETAAGIEYVFFNTSGGKTNLVFLTLDAALTKLKQILEAE